MPKIILNYCDRLDQVRSMTKTKQENYVTDSIGVIYVETEIGLS